LLLLAPLALLLGTATPVRAAHLDEGLLKAAPDLLIYLKKEGYRNVGVLPFKVKKGTRQASYLGAPLTASMPGRLENALIMSQGKNEAAAIGIIRDAAGMASRAKVGSYTRSPVAFTKLFKTSYNLAWGGKKVKADAFLTGIVSNTGDRSETTVQIQFFTPKSRSGGSLKVVNVGDPIVVKTDRSLLRDMGYTYALARSMTKRGVTAARRDQQAVDQVVQQEQGKKQQKQGQSGAITPDNIAGFAFELRYSGVKQTFRPMAQSQQGAKARDYLADPVMPGTAVTMALTPLLPDGKKLGIVLKVNGRSTWQEEAEESIKCRKWIYDLEKKDKEDVFEGIYTDVSGKNLKPWGVLSAAESAKMASEMGERAGWIDIDVYASGDKVDQKQQSDEEEVMISTRGLARSRKKFATLEQLQKTLRKANNVKAKKALVQKRGPGGLIVSDSEPAEANIQIDTGDLPNPIHLGGISIKYYDPKSGGGETPDDPDPE
jgi:hypothetical protein